EVFHPRHVDAITVRIADLWSRRNNDDLFRPNTVQHLEYTLLQCRTPYDRIVDDDDSVLFLLYYLICGVVNVRHQLVPVHIIGNESSQLGIFDHELFHPWTESQ